MSAPLHDFEHGQDTLETERRAAAAPPADDPSLVSVSPSRDLLIHCSGPEREAEVGGCSSCNKAAWITSAVGSQPSVDSWLCH